MSGKSSMNSSDDVSSDCLTVIPCLRKASVTHSAPYRSERTSRTRYCLNAVENSAATWSGRKGAFTSRTTSRSAPMPTECSADLFGFAPVEGREVVAAFDGGAITSDAGALLLGAADHAIKLTERFAACFHDARR